MSREVCGICWCPYDEDTGECACEPEPKSQHMTTLREAAQQALEALQNCANGEDDVLLTRDALAALRSALAEPTPLEDVVTHGSAWSKDGKRIDPMSVYAEPVEPVAWMYEWKHRLHGGSLNVSRARCPESDLWIETPLYAAPPQRKPLTDEELRDLWSWAMTAEAERTATTQQHAFARAIERAHGIT